MRLVVAPRLRPWATDWKELVRILSQLEMALGKTDTFFFCLKKFWIRVGAQVFSEDISPWARLEIL